ncbi:MAG: aromatic amino acid hydroxylase [Bdellovibrionales bacterium]|nr:aromatic amino acid hydroxylase [Bdellovibrionales bacterium]
MNTAFNDIPAHLKQYVAAQSSDEYTPIQHATWRFILRQLKVFLEKHAHPFYLEGMKKSGIEVDRIPSISEISSKLEDYGWRCVPVSGFLPPAAFMELQAMSYLPIAKEIRGVHHIPYTPAPDIVHEAAGHATYLPHPDFAEYLHSYAQISKKCIISSEDFAIYQAIRELSDVKESPGSTTEQVQAATKNLETAIANVTYVSEATKVSRLYWWTAEYGLIGDIKNPKIYGAGLLSSISESKNFLSEKVKKIPLSVECIDYAFDITEEQPQLFVAKDFAHLNKVLTEMGSTFSYITGGETGLSEAKRAKTVNTVELNSGLQISGKLAEYRVKDLKPYYIRFEGPCQLSFDNRQLPGHEKEYHQHGYSTIIGNVIGSQTCLSLLDMKSLHDLGFQSGKVCNISFESGIQLSGVLTEVFQKNGKNLFFTFTECTLTHGEEVLFKPEWGTFDLGIGTYVSSVFGGPADHACYGEIENFKAVAIPTPKPTEKEKRLFLQYSKVADVRKAFLSKKLSPQTLEERCEDLYKIVSRDFPSDWLLFVELLELSHQLPTPPKWHGSILTHLKNVADANPELSTHILDSIKLAPELVI